MDTVIDPGAATSSQEQVITIGSVIEDRWIVHRQLGEGSFGAVYKVEDKKDLGKFYALKLEPLAQTDRDPPRMMPFEVTVLRALRDVQAKRHPRYISCGFTEKFNYVVMALVGKNTSDLRKQMPGRKFKLRTVVHVAHETLESIKELHEAGFIHRDIKPANICIGRAPDDLRSVYMVDWGLCRRYLNDQGEVHRPRVKAPFRGTPRYSSVRTLHDLEQCRADDIWSWFLCLIVFTIGRLPWDDEQGPNDPEEYLLWLAKIKTVYMCNGQKISRNCPNEYDDIYRLLNSASYYDRPNYERFHIILNVIFQRNDLHDFEPLDWERNSTAASKIRDIVREQSKKRAYGEECEL